MEALSVVYTDDLDLSRCMATLAIGRRLPVELEDMVMGYVSVSDHTRGTSEGVGLRV